MNTQNAEMVTLFSAFIEDICAKYRVTDVKESLAKMLLADKAIIHDSTDKFETVMRYSEMGVTGKVDPFHIEKATIRLNVSLPVDQRTRLELINDDVKLVFPTNGIHMPHSMAFAQRAIDTERLFNLIPLADGNVLDIGGNYHAHARRARNVVCHSCTKRSGVQEAARQKYREVMMETEELTGDFCTGGTEVCDVQAKRSISIHAITDIDPSLWPEIFSRHGLLSHVAVFHFDYDMIDSDMGYLSDANMHWYKNGDKMVFYFENDSSNAYEQSLPWLLKYGSSWNMSRPDDDFVLQYQVDFVQGGRAQATMRRLAKSTIAPVEPKPMYRYTNREHMISVSAPRFSGAPGADIKNPHDYVMDSVDVPISFYEFVHKRAYANYVNEPNAPLSISDVRRLARSYDFTRNLSGTSVTVRADVTPELIERIVMGVYLIVRRRMAMDKVVTGAAMRHFAELKKAWGDFSWFRTIGTGLMQINLLPAMLIVDTFNDQVALLAAHMRGVVRANYVTPPDPKQVLVMPVTPVEQIDNVPMLLEYKGMKSQALQFDKFADEISVAEYYQIAKDTLSEDERGRLELYLETHKPQGAPPPLNDSAASYFIGSTPEDEEEVMTREKWITDYTAFQQHVLDCAEDLPPKWDPDVESEERISPDLAGKFFNARIQEYGLACADVGTNALKSAQVLLRQTWKNMAPDGQAISRTNIQYDSGVRYVTVSNLKLDMNASNASSVVIDPWDMKMYKVKVTPKGYFVDAHKSQYLFTCASLEVFNYFILAGNAHRISLAAPEKTDAFMTMHEGIAGCGKSYTIMQKFTLDDVIVVANKGTCAEIFRALIKDDRFKKVHGIDKILTGRVRTLDSANMHGLPRAKHLYVDEAVLAHSGAICMAMYSCGCNAVDMFGDSYQIGSIDRGSKTGTLRFGGFYYFSDVVEYNTSLRCPADAMWLSRKFYPEKRRAQIKTLNPKLRSLELLVVKSSDDPALKVAKVPYHYMTVMRADKGVLMATGRFIEAKSDYSEFGDMRPLGTVHERQGLTKPYVATVRTNIFNATVLEQPGHINVMFTRHTHGFIYKTPVNSKADRVASMILEVANVSDDDLRAVVGDTPEWLSSKFDKITQEYISFV